MSFYVLVREEDCNLDKEAQFVPHQEDLDPVDFAPTGDIYSYFHRRRMDPFRFSNPLVNTVRNSCGGRQGKLFVFWKIMDVWYLVCQLKLVTWDTHNGGLSMSIV